LAPSRLLESVLIIALGLFSFGFATPAAHSASGWNWTMSWDFNATSYVPGASGTVSFSLVNTGSVSLRITEVGIQFDWQQAANKWWSATTSSNSIDPSQRRTLATVNFDVPSGTSDGKHKFRAGVYQSHLETYYNSYGFPVSSWVDDGAQWTDWSDVTVQALKPVLNIVSVTNLPPLDRPLYVGEKTTYVAVISNTGNAKAASVKVVMEDLAPSTGLSFTNADVKDLDPGATGQWKIDVQGGQPGKYRGVLRGYMGTARIMEQPWQLEVTIPAISISSKAISPQGQVYVGDLISVTYKLRNDAPVDAKAITFDVKPGDGVTVVESPNLSVIPSQTAVTVTLKLKADKASTSLIQLTVMEYGVQVQQDKLTIMISERPLWMQSWFVPAVGGVVAVLLVSVVVLLIMRRSPKTTPLVTSLPESRPLTSSGTTCSRCGKPLTYVSSRSKYYCTRCKEYF
jgi:hypothetical protein